MNEATPATRAQAIRARQGWPARATRALSGFAVATLLAVAMVPAYGDAARWDGCDSCEVFLGIGYTYHMWGETGGFVLPATLTLGQGRYEVGVFRITSDQYNPWISGSRRGRKESRSRLTCGQVFGLAGPACRVRRCPRCSGSWQNLRAETRARSEGKAGAPCEWGFSVPD